MNFFPGTLLGFEGANAVVDAGRAGRILVHHEPNGGKGRAGDSVVVAVRPEKIEFGGNSAEALNRLSGALVAKSYLGDRNHLFVRVDGIDKPIALSSQNAARNEAPTSSESTPVWICWPAENGILLPAH